MKTLKLLYITIFIFFAPKVFAQPNYSSDSDGNWNVSTRWTPNGIPTSTSDVTINDNITLDVSTVIRNLIGSTGATLTIPEGDTLTITGPGIGDPPISVDFKNGANLIVNGTLIVESGTMDFGNNATLTVNGSVFVLSGSLVANNNLNISANGSFYVSGDVSIANNYDVIIEGSFTVDGNLTALAGNPKSFSGSGTLDVGGTTTVGGTIATTLTVVSTRWNGVGTDWATAANWTKGLPAATASVVIPSVLPLGGTFFPIISSTVSIADLIIESGASVTVNSTFSTSDKIVSDGTILLGTNARVTVATTFVNNGSLTIASTGGVTVTGDFTNSGTVNVKSDASGTGWLFNSASLLGSGTYSVENYLTGGDFHYVSASLSAVNSS
ncbi:MAG TPA: hypothetical protein DCQ31_17350, partial [Bacteroidales bacterium]|nr:hypothetical protein [Bacteroidales bacterium]